MDIFRTLGSRSLSVTATLHCSGKANTSIHGLGEDDTATFYNAKLNPPLFAGRAKLGIIKRLVLSGTHMYDPPNQRGSRIKANWPLMDRRVSEQQGRRLINLASGYILLRLWWPIATPTAQMNNCEPTSRRPINLRGVPRACPLPTPYIQCPDVHSCTVISVISHGNIKEHCGFIGPIHVYNIFWYRYNITWHIHFCEICMWFIVDRPHIGMTW